MLKNLFNNPWFIASLGVFASIYLGYSIAKPLFFDNSIAAAENSEIPPFMDMPIEQAGDGRVNRALAADKREQIRWLDNVERDPFASTLIDANTSGHDLPTVGALFVSDGVKAAVVNNRLVRVGDKVAEYQVTHIGLAHVELQRFGKFYRLEPEV
ncbi:MAG: hypothetical protein AAF993_12575 [Pseudomonadota bacterium]